MLEALAIGLPSICTDCPAGGAKMTIINNYNGYLVGINDYFSMYSYMKKIVSDKKLASYLSNNAMLIRNKYSIESISNKWEDIL